MDYLYILAQVMATFSAFAVIFMTVRQFIGGDPSPIGLFAILNFLMLNFLQVLGALLPPLLNSFFKSEWIWRAPSYLVAFFLFIFAVSLPWRRRAISEAGPTPRFIWVRESIHIGVVLILVLGAAVP